METSRKITFANQVGGEITIYPILNEVLIQLNDHFYVNKDQYEEFKTGLESLLRSFII